MKSTGFERVAVSLAVIALVCLAGLTVGCDGLAPGTQPAPPGAAQGASDESDLPASESGISVIGIRDLPPEAGTVLELIENGGPFPFEKDGAVFHNYEGILPEKADGYYREYTVVTPGSSDRGARRIVAGQRDERYYTDDHYNSFSLVVE